jgi:hypothetical protein
MGARLETEEPASVDMTPEVAHDQEVPVEDAVVMPVGEPRKRRRDQRHLVAQRRQKEEGEPTETVETTHKLTPSSTIYTDICQCRIEQQLMPQIIQT